MAQPSSIAWLIWTQKTGGNQASEPTLEDVEALVKKWTANAIERDYWKNWEKERQRNPKAEIIVEFLDIELVEAGVGKKKFELPGKVLSLPRERGLDMITYGDPSTEILMVEKRYLDDKEPGQRLFESEYYAYRTGKDIYIEGQCRNETPELDKANLQIAMVDTNNIPDILEAVVVSEVMKELNNNQVVPDNIDDQRGTR